MKVKVYQIDSERDQNRVKFMGYDLTQKHGGVNPTSYRCVYSGEVDASNLEDVYEKLNFGRPARFFAVGIGYRRNHRRYARLEAVPEHR